MTISATIGHMNGHYIARCVSIRVVVYAAMRMKVNVLLQLLLAKNISVQAKYARKKQGRNKDTVERAAKTLRAARVQAQGIARAARAQARMPKVEAVHSSWHLCDGCSRWSQMESFKH